MEPIQLSQSDNKLLNKSKPMLMSDLIPSVEPMAELSKEEFVARFNKVINRPDWLAIFKEESIDGLDKILNHPEMLAIYNNLK